MNRVDKPTSYGNKDWELGIRLSWRLKEGSSEHLECPNCNGTGGWSGGFGSPDDEWRDCGKCVSGKIRNPDCLDAPGKLPKEWVKHVFECSKKFIDIKGKIKRRYLTTNQQRI